MKAQSTVHGYIKDVQESRKSSRYEKNCAQLKKQNLIVRYANFAKKTDFKGLAFGIGTIQQLACRKLLNNQIATSCFSEIYKIRIF